MQSLKKIHAWAQMKVPLSCSFNVGYIFDTKTFMVVYVL